MSSARLNIAIAPSRLHAQILVGGHLLLLAAILLLPTAPVAKAVLLLMLAGNGYLTYKTMLKQQHITHLNLEHNQLAAVHLGQWRGVTALEPVLVTAWLTIIRVKLDAQSYLLPLWRDSADSEELRRLRVWLIAGGWKR